MNGCRTHFPEDIRWSGPRWPWWVVGGVGDELGGVDWGGGATEGPIDSSPVYIHDYEVIGECRWCRVLIVWSSRAI